MGYRPAYYLDAMISQPASVRFANGNLQIPGPVDSPVVLPRQNGPDLQETVPLLIAVP
jgi:hypothetical protein